MEREITGWPGYYATADGRILSGKSGRMVEKAQHLDKWGYRRVTLSCGQVQRPLHVHRLVLEAFVGPRPGGYECRHIDGDKENNRLDNITWGTSKENKADSLRLGVVGPGDLCPWRKLSSQDVASIRARVARGERRADLARAFGITVFYVGQLVRPGPLWDAAGGPRKVHPRSLVLVRVDDLSGSVGELACRLRRARGQKGQAKHADRRRARAILEELGVPPCRRTVRATIIYRAGYGGWSVRVPATIATTGRAYLRAGFGHGAAARAEADAFASDLGSRDLIHGRDWGEIPARGGLGPRARPRPRAPAKLCGPAICRSAS